VSMVSTTSVSLHIATVRQFNPATGVATLVVPGLYGDAAVEAWPFLTAPSEAVNLPVLKPGDTVIAFYDGGNPLTVLRWYHTGGGTGGGGGGGITTEDAVDAVAAALRPGTGVSIVYDDALGTITITNTAGAGGLDTEGVIDAVAAALTAGSGINISYNDTAGTITIISTTADEVWIGPTAPTDPGIELWYDSAGVEPVQLILSYTHVQSVAAETWIIDHPLDFQPNVTARDTAGDQIEGDVNYPSDSRVILTFSAATSGTAVLS
jgi:hypothetical protein